ncbi:uncharacterized protein [Euphorbia lathyris]|uniref:uncharacterized protein n=1 Tax=Euphorbia lathyris TaxID=212925 RepID=UPI0033133F16
MRPQKSKSRSFAEIVSNPIAETDSEDSGESSDENYNRSSSNVHSNFNEEPNRENQQPDLHTVATMAGNSQTTQVTSIDNPSMILVTSVLNGNNYIAWKRAMMLALSAKRKLKFIKENNEPADEKSEEYAKWKWDDDLVFSWIRSSLTKELADVFLFAKSSYSLWQEIEQRYGQSNGPLIYQLRKEISSLSQGNLSLVDYFNKIKRRWDELAEIKPLLSCTCGEARRQAQDQLEEEQLMQFLSGLHIDFDNVREQILIQEPLPSVNKAYSMLMRIERQRSMSNTEMKDDFVNLSKSQNNKSNTRNGGKKYQNRGQSSDTSKDDKFCTHCKKPGHEKVDCFKLVGYPDWYKGKKSAPYKQQAHMSKEESNPLADTDSENEVEDSKMEMMIERALQKALKNKGSIDNNKHHEFSAFAGMSSAGPSK